MREQPDHAEVRWSSDQLVARGHAIANLRTAAADLVDAAARISECFRRGGNLLVFGNGGSAAQAQHLAGEFVGRYNDQREGLPAIALVADGAVLTGLANDFGYSSVFARQIEALGSPGDVALAISTSGSSPSTVAGATVARDRGLCTVGIIGTPGSLLHEVVDVAILTPAPTPARAQELQLVVCHMVCEMVEQDLLSNAGNRERPVEQGTLTVSELLSARARWRELGLSVVWTNGCFDLLHAGHVRMLREARALGDILVVGVNDDDSVRRLKGEGRPVVPLEDRLEVLLALDTVDRVVVIDDDPTSLLAQVRPDVHCKGGDYQADVRSVPELSIIESFGGVFRVLDYLDGRSTTAIVDRIANQTTT